MSIFHHRSDHNDTILVSMQASQSFTDNEQSNQEHTVSDPQETVVPQDEENLLLEQDENIHSQEEEHVPLEQEETVLENEVLANSRVNILPASKSKTVQRLKSYPIVKETRDGLDNVAITRVTVANIKIIVTGISKTKFIKFFQPVATFIDNVGDGTLNLTEKVMPSVKTKTFKKMCNDMKGPCKFMEKKSDSIKCKSNKLIKKKVYFPVHKKLINWRIYYNKKFINTNNAPLVRSVMDPVLKPCNNVFEKSIETYIPVDKKKELYFKRDKFCVETSRSLFLTGNLVERLIPIMLHDTKVILLIPVHILIYLNKIFNKALDEQKDLGLKSTFKAIFKVITILNEKIKKEIFNKKKFKKGIFKKKKSNKAIEISDEQEPIIENTQEVQVY